MGATVTGNYAGHRNVFNVGFEMVRVRTSSRAMLAVYIAIHTYIVMLDSEDSTVTYTAVSSPFEGLLDIGSPGVDAMMLEDPHAYVVVAFQAPPSPDYVSGSEEQEQAPPLPEFVLEPVYPEFMPLEDDVLLVEEQPLPAAVSPTTDSPGYIPESDPEEDPEEDDDEDPEEDLADYPTNRDDDDDEEEEEEPSRDEADDEEDDEDDEKEEEHPASADTVPPPPVYRTTTRISNPAQALVPFLSKEEVERFLTIPTLPPSPLTPLIIRPLHSYHLTDCSITTLTYITSTTTFQSPSTSHLLPLPPPIILSHTKAPMAMMMTVVPSTYTLAPPSGTLPLLPIPLPTSLPPLLLPSTDRKADRPEVCLPPQKRTDYGFIATLDPDIRRDPKRDVGYRITDTWDEMLDIDKIYGRLDEAQVARAVLRVRSTLLIEREARLSREAWRRSVATSDAAYFEVMALRTIVLGQQGEIAAMRAADRTL
ncbi:hypothetical protein Tco_1235780 [Tanacetum coccineum]